MDGSFHAVFPFPFVFSLGVCVGHSELQVPGEWPLPNLASQEELVATGFYSRMQILLDLPTSENDCSAFSQTTRVSFASLALMQWPRIFTLFNLVLVPLKKLLMLGDWC